VGRVTTQVSDAPVGSVISQSLEEGSENPARVNLVESSGNATVPNVLGDLKAEAFSHIRGAGLVVGTVTSVDDCIDPGRVGQQYPQGGAWVLRGSAVNINVSICSDGLPR
jgi:beta-lactam-binding protein with PASTA domain